MLKRNKTKVVKSKSLFDHLNEVLCGHDKDYFQKISEQDKRSWSNYMLNRFLSMEYNYIDVVNELQKISTEVSPEIYHKLLINILPKRKLFNKYIKKEVSEHGYSDDVVKLLCQHFECSSKDVREYFKILKKHDVELILKKYGVEV